MLYRVSLAGKCQGFLVPQLGYRNTVKEAELLLTMRRVVGGIDIQEDLSSFTDLFVAERDELIEQSLIQAHQFVRGGRIFPTTERRLGAESVPQRLIGENLKCRIVT